MDRLAIVALASCLLCATSCSEKSDSSTQVANADGLEAVDMLNDSGVDANVGGGPDHGAQAGAGSTFSPDGCLQTHFASALAMGMSPPPEVMFYCARDWDFNSLGRIERGLRSSGVDPVESVVAAVPALKRPILRLATRGALQQAEHGPEGMRESWLAYRFAPMLWGLHERQPAMLDLAAKMALHDREALARLTQTLPWSSCVTRDGCSGNGGAKLRDVAGIAMSTSAGVP